MHHTAGVKEPRPEAGENRRSLPTGKAKTMALKRSIRATVSVRNCSKVWESCVIAAFSGTGL
jgi:hypothetical protein